MVLSLKRPAQIHADSVWLNGHRCQLSASTVSCRLVLGDLDPVKVATQDIFRVATPKKISNREPNTVTTGTKRPSWNFLGRDPIENFILLSSSCISWLVLRKISRSRTQNIFLGRDRFLEFWVATYGSPTLNADTEKFRPHISKGSPVLTQIFYCFSTNFSGFTTNILISTKL
jgi:hypothetical protein